MINSFVKKCFLNKNSKITNNLCFKSFSTGNKRVVTDTKDLRLNSSFVDSAHPDINKTLVFLHGLFGNSNNWRSISYSEAVRARRRSLLVDLRNHGDSDHCQTMSYQEMADDVIRHMDSLNINKFTLLGHSMGGKVAMHISTKYADRLDGLVIVDSAPKDHKDNVNIYGGTKDIVKKVSVLDTEGKTRKEVLNDLKNLLNGSVANLLNTNLTYTAPDTDKVTWKCNMQAINENIDNIIGFEDTTSKYPGPLTIILGEKSFIFPIDVYREIFPHATEEDVKIVAGAGHWVHVDKPSETIVNIVKFLDKIDNKL
jgi:pimeloyl-ACP methyl ester carboxylesterase